MSSGCVNVHSSRKRLRTNTEEQNRTTESGEKKEDVEKLWLSKYPLAIFR